MDGGGEKSPTLINNALYNLKGREGLSVPKQGTGNSVYLYQKHFQLDCTHVTTK